jgi:hypothetical protein
VRPEGLGQSFIFSIVIYLCLFFVVNLIALSVYRNSYAASSRRMASE